MKKIYVAHPYTGKEKENVEDARCILQKAHGYHPMDWFTCPLGEFPISMDYDTVMRHCLARLAECDAVLFCAGWETSKGCQMEHDYATKKKMKIYYNLDEISSNC